MVGGVCAGLAHNFRADPSLIRIIMAFLILGAGVGVLPCLLMWVILPEAPLGKAPREGD